MDFPPFFSSSFEAYQTLTTNRGEDQVLVCHRKCYLLTKDKIYTIDTEPETEQRDIYSMTIVLVNILVASCVQESTEMFSLILVSQGLADFGSKMMSKIID